MLAAKVASNAGSNGFSVDRALYNLLDQLCRRAELCGEPNGEELLGCDFDQMDHLDSDSSMNIGDESIENANCTALKPQRHLPKFEADRYETSKSRGQCHHGSQGGAGKTGGVFTVFCRHGICYTAFMIEKAEGRKELFSWIVQYLKEAPEVVVYDFACAFHEYCLNRLPRWFRDTRCLVDRLHWDNHKTCSLGYWIGMYFALEAVNSVIAEQNNSALRRVERTLSRSTQTTFMVLLRCFMHVWNNAKVSKLLPQLRFGHSVMPGPAENGTT